MITLTLDPRKVAKPDEVETFYAHLANSGGKACSCEICKRVHKRSVAYIRDCWAKLRVYLHRRCGDAPAFIAVIEFQQRTGLAHLHIAFDRYIPQPWLKENWQAIGGGQHVDVRMIDAHRMAAYFAKYLTKELLLGIPEGVRRVTTSRGLKLSEKKVSELQWELCKSPIDDYYRLYAVVAAEVKEEDGELHSFVIYMLNVPVESSS